MGVEEGRGAHFWCETHCSVVFPVWLGLYELYGAACPTGTGEKALNVLIRYG